MAFTVRTALTTPAGADSIGLSGESILMLIAFVSPCCHTLAMNSGVVVATSTPIVAILAIYCGFSSA
jgi:hypothetical protein